MGMTSEFMELTYRWEVAMFKRIWDDGDCEN